MSDWLGALLALLATFAPLLVAWWLLGREEIQAGSRRHGKMSR